MGYCIIRYKGHCRLPVPPGVKKSFNSLHDYVL